MYITDRVGVISFNYSHIDLPAPSISNQVFSLELEKGPVHVQADYSAVLKIQPVEIVYDQVWFVINSRSFSEWTFLVLNKWSLYANHL